MEVLFARYYKDKNNLVENSMNELETWLKDEKRKVEIADSIFNRLYERYLKIFFFEINQCESSFKKEFKNGFVIMASSCLLIETLAAFIQGNNETKGNGDQNFDFIFDKAKSYNNDLAEFKGKRIYANVRNGILHQGETKSGFIIKREGELFDGDKTINAAKFAKSLKEFLQHYIVELKNADWESEIWTNCKRKINYIISNSKL